MMGSLQPLVLLQNFSGVNLSKVLSRKSALPGNRETEQPSKRPVAELEWKPSSPLSEWPCAGSGSTNVSFLSRWPGDLGAAEVPRHSMGTSTQPAATALALGLITLQQELPGNQSSPGRMSLVVVTRVLGGFLLLLFGLAPEWFTFASLAVKLWGLNTEVLKGVNCDFEMPLAGAPQRLEAAFGAAVCESIPKTCSKWSWTLQCPAEFSGLGCAVGLWMS